MKKLARHVNWAASAAACKAGAYASNMPSYKVVRKLWVSSEPEFKGQSFDPPQCVFNITNGAMHSAKTFARQHFVIYHQFTATVEQAIKRTKDLYDSYFKIKISKGNGEACYTPSIQDIKEGVETLTKIIDEMGYRRDVKIGLDVGASQFYERGGTYRFSLKEEDLISAKALNDVYVSLLKEYGLVFMEDLFHHDNWECTDLRNFSCVTVVSSEKWKFIMDLMRTKSHRVCNTLLLKVSKVGSVTELIDFVTFVKRCNMTFVMDSHISCESSDPFIADLCLGLLLNYIKIGVSCITSNCKICDQFIEIENKRTGNLRIVGIPIGGFEALRPGMLELVGGEDDTEEWNERDCPDFI